MSDTDTLHEAIRELNTLGLSVEFNEEYIDIKKKSWIRKRIHLAPYISEDEVVKLIIEFING